MVPNVLLALLILIIPAGIFILRRYFAGYFAGLAAFTGAASLEALALIMDLALGRAPVGIPDPNIFEYRYLGIWNAGHTLSWAAIFTAGLVVLFTDALRHYRALPFRRAQARDPTRYSWERPVEISLAVIFMAVGVHEYIWFFFYFLSAATVWAQPWLIPITLTINHMYYVLFIIFMFELIGLAAILTSTKNVMLVMLLALPYYLVWYIIGFPVTLNNIYGVTLYYISPLANAIEVVSWIYVPMVAMLVAIFYGKTSKATTGRLGNTNTYNRPLH
ncbi:MAG: hypothetical protein ACP5UD_09360 [Conexivisphaera sp.]